MLPNAQEGSCYAPGVPTGVQPQLEKPKLHNTSPRGVLEKPVLSLGTMTTDEAHGRSGDFDIGEQPLQSARIQSYSMELDDHTSDESDNSEDESCLRRSARNHGTDRPHSVSVL